MALEKEYLVPVDMHSLQIKNHRLENYAGNKVLASEGLIWYDSTSHEPKVQAIRGVINSPRALISDDDDFKNRLNTVTTIQDADMLMIWDDSATAIDHQSKYRQISKANFVSGLSTVLNSYYRVSVDSGMTNLDAVGSSKLIISGDGNVLQTVGSNPLTNTIEIALLDQTANRIFAGPSSGGAAVPTFRTLVDADMPTSYDSSNWDNAYAHSQLTTGNPHAVRHPELDDLDSDDHSQYALLTGRLGDSLTIDNLVEFTLDAGITIAGNLTFSGTRTIASTTVGAGTGSDISLIGGASSSGSGGNVSITAGASSGTGAGGSVSITATNGSIAGGSVNINAGGSGANGNLINIGTTSGYQIKMGLPVFMTGLSLLTNVNYLRFNSTTGAITYLNSSDIRLKRNITTWEPDSLSFLRDQPLILFDRKDGSSFREIGWNANVMAELMPDMVDVDDKGYYTFKEAHFPFHFARAIKQLDIKVESNEDKIKRLEERVKELETQLK